MSEESFQLIYRYSNGIPRVINLICDHAMISAYVEQLVPIPARIIESVSVELDLELEPLPASNDEPTLESADAQKEREI
jgi:general secretion pathway protein A